VKGRRLPLSLVIRAVALTLLIALLWAASRTENTYPCPPPPDDPNAYCQAIEKVVVHPSDLVSNAQGSRTRFVRRLVRGSAIVFPVVLLLLAVAAADRRRSGAGRSS
jgi:hypothetical protein